MKAVKLNSVNSIYFTGMFVCREKKRHKDPERREKKKERKKCIRQFLYIFMCLSSYFNKVYKWVKVRYLTKSKLKSSEFTEKAKPSRWDANFSLLLQK